MAVLEVLNDKVAQELLTSTELARFAYTWRDGTPRVVPVWFHWTGTEVVIGSPSNAPKVKVLGSRPEVAVTIDGSSWPYHTLLLRGTATVEHLDGVVPEYAAAAERYFGPEQGSAWVAQVREMGLAWARIGITPTHATILDFETRFPSALAG
ncbi:MAG: pyridoxamine 5'-phosphate oxidase family protein [Acidimicrobiales bacterium]